MRTRGVSLNKDVMDAMRGRAPSSGAGKRHREAVSEETQEEVVMPCSSSSGQESETGGGAWGVRNISKHFNEYFR